jgi:hypothetical protein
MYYNKFRLVHDLSFPKKSGINATISRDFSAVQYETIEAIMNMVLECGPGCLIAKADIENAFRILPTHPSEYHLLGFTWNNNYYYHKRLVMGASTSCSTFEQFSRSLQWIMQHCFNVKYISHILDDFIFLGPAHDESCKTSLSNFISLSSELNIPLNMTKTVYPSTKATVHGYEIDTTKMIICLPQEKITKAKSELKILFVVKKATLQKIQSVIGFLYMHGSKARKTISPQIN